MGEDKKANWPGHLDEIVHAYNATWSAVTGYSPHYLMFRCMPRLPIDFYFPSLRSTEVPKQGALAKHVDEYAATVRDQLRVAPHEAQTQSMAKAWRQKWYYDWKIGAIGLKPGDLILVKADTFQEEDQGQMGGQASWGSTSDCNRCILIQSEGPVWKFTHPTSQPAPPHCIRSWYSLACGHLPSMGWMYQSHPSQAYSQREWPQDNATRRQWSGNDPVSD